MELLHRLERLGLSPRAALATTQVLITVTVAVVLIALARWTAAQLKAGARWLRVAAGCRAVPAAPGGGLLNIGHALQLACAPCPWEKMLEWARATGPLTRFNILHRTGLIVNDAEGAKRVFQVCWCRWDGKPGSAAAPLLSIVEAWRSAGGVPTVTWLHLYGRSAHPAVHPRCHPQTRQRLYEKDLDFSYKPFLSILGTGLVTADGAHWQKQRLLMAPALRVDMLDAIIPIAAAAVERLCTHLETFRGTGRPGERAATRAAQSPGEGMQGVHCCLGVVCAMRHHSFLPHRCAVTRRAFSSLTAVPPQWTWRRSSGC